MHKYKQEELVGTGIVSRVYKARRKGTTDTVTNRNDNDDVLTSTSAELQPLVIKRILNASINLRLQETALQEATLLMRLAHPNIMRVLDCFGDNPDICIVMPYICGGSLFDLLDRQNKETANNTMNKSPSNTTNERGTIPSPSTIGSSSSGKSSNSSVSSPNSIQRSNSNGSPLANKKDIPLVSTLTPLSSESILYVAYQLIDAIAYLHDLDILHRDIKPENILLHLPEEAKPLSMTQEYNDALQSNSTKLARNTTMYTDGGTTTNTNIDYSSNIATSSNRSQKRTNNRNTQNDTRKTTSNNSSTSATTSNVVHTSTSSSTAMGSKVSIATPPTSPLVESMNTSLICSNLFPTSTIATDANIIHFDVILSDFNTITILEGTMHTYNFVGTRAYMAPEILAEEPYGKPADIWSYGATLFTLATGLLIGGSPRERGELLRGTWNIESFLGRATSSVQETWNTLPVELRNLITNCVALDPNDRPKAETLQSERLFDIPRMVRTEKLALRNFVLDQIRFTAEPFIKLNRKLTKINDSLSNDITEARKEIKKLKTWSPPLLADGEVNFGTSVANYQDLGSWRQNFPQPLIVNLSGRAYLNDGDLRHLQGIKALNISGIINMTGITDAGFENLRGIHTLYMAGLGTNRNNMYGNNIINLTSNLFRHLMGIKILDISNCPPVLICDRLFTEYLSGIEILKMNGVDYTTWTFPVTVFQNLVGMKKLYLTKFLHNGGPEFLNRLGTILVGTEFIYSN